MIFTTIITDKCTTKDKQSWIKLEQKRMQCIPTFSQCLKLQSDLKELKVFVNDVGQFYQILDKFNIQNCINYKHN